MKKSIILLLAFLLVSCQLNKPNNKENLSQNDTSMYDIKEKALITPTIDATVISTRYLEQDMGEGVDEYGIPEKKLSYFEVLTQLKNNSNKATKKIIVSVFFRQKDSDPNNIYAESDTYNAEKEIEILPNVKMNVAFTIFPKDDINMVYSGIIIQRIIYNDGTYEDL